MWAAEPVSNDRVAVYEFSPKLEAAIRAQSPSPVYDPFNSGPTLQAPVPAGADPYSTFGAPSMSAPYEFNPSSPQGFDPGMGGAAPGTVYAGVNGPQPFRFGYIPKMEMGYIPESDFSDFDAGVEMFELDTELRYNTPFSTGWVLSSAPQFDYRAWSVDGTLSPMNRINLYRFGWDLELLKMKSNGWTWDFAVTPSINTDTEHNLTSNAWNFDARIAASYQIDPALMVVLGIQYWDRVDDILIPYGGLVYNPNDLWEIRATFPEARVSRFVGYFWGGHHWLYSSLEYNVEAYQIDTTPIGSSPANRVQYEDWRWAVGLRSDHVTFDKFIEIAWLFDRNFEFAQDIQKQSVADQVMIRGGIRF